MKRQAELVGISRAAVYYVPRPISGEDLELQRRIDALHLEHPFAGSRLLKRLLRREGIAVVRKHVATLMRRMGIEALYRKKSTSKPHPEGRHVAECLSAPLLDSLLQLGCCLIGEREGNNVSWNASTAASRSG